MTLPFAFPDWVPWWVQSVVVILAVLFGLALLLMPFSVFGTKSRLELLEARLDDIHADLRALAQRLPERGRTGGDAYDGPLIATRPRSEPADALRAGPPIPPAAYYPEPEDPEDRRPWRRPAERRRSEPRLDRPGE